MLRRILTGHKNKWMLLCILGILLCCSNRQVFAEEGYHKGGLIALTQDPHSMEYWIYTGYSGSFTYEGEDIEFYSSDDDVLAVKSNGKYQTKDEGTVSLKIKKKGQDSAVSAGYTVHVVDYPTRLSISPRQKMQISPSQDAKYPLKTDFTISGIPTGNKANIKLSVTEGDVIPYISRRGNKVYLTASHGGNCTVVLSYAGVDKVFRWTIKGIACEEPAFLMRMGENRQIKVLNAGYRNFKWESADEKIATITSTGRVSAKRTGNVVITGIHKSKDYKVGCVVSVTTPQKVAAIESGKAIAKGTYSQPRRMQRGYYDCSSLVWLSYAPNGCNFGVSRGNAPVAASEAAYLEQRGKIVGEWRETDMKKMRYLAGDLMFRTNTGNGRHRGINHVEMIAGYYLTQFDLRGKPGVLVSWVNRTPEYSLTLNPYDIVCRP